MNSLDYSKNYNLFLKEKEAFEKNFILLTIPGNLEYEIIGESKSLSKVVGKKVAGKGRLLSENLNMLFWCSTCGYVSCEENFYFSSCKNIWTTVADFACKLDKKI